MDYLETPPPEERSAPFTLPLPPRATSSSPAGSPQRQRSNSLYNLFLTAVGLTPRGVDTFSPGSMPAEGEEDFWSVYTAGDDRATSTNTAAISPPSERQRAPRQPLAVDRAWREAGSPEAVAAYPPRATTEAFAVGRGGGVDQAVEREFVMSGQQPSGDLSLEGGNDRGEGGDTGGGDAGVGVSSRPPSTSRALQLSPALAARYPGSRSDGLDSTEDHAENGFPRRRRRQWLRDRTLGAEPADSGPRNHGNGRPRPPRMFSLGNPLFRADPAGTSSRSGQSNGHPPDDGDSSANAGTRAVERAVTNVAPSGRDGGSGGDSGVDGDEATEQGRVLFYHKPTLANVPAGDIPDSVPVYLGCPGGGMALGLPLNEAWQGEDHQDTTFNQNLSYTILSWPEDHVHDLLELWRLQVSLSIAMIFNILVAALLFFVENSDRTRVESPRRAGAYPGPFEQRNASDEPTGISSQEWHVGAVLVIGLLGILSVMTRVRAGIALYLCLTVVNAMVGLSHAPDAIYACRFAVDLILVAMGRSFLSKLTYSWVTASAGEARRPW